MLRGRIPKSGAHTRSNLYRRKPDGHFVIFVSVRLVTTGTVVGGALEGGRDGWQ